jgi:hypothetical protein
MTTLEKLAAHIEANGTLDSEGIKSIKVIDGDVYYLIVFEREIHVRVIGAGSYRCTTNAEAADWCKLLGVE